MSDTVLHTPPEAIVPFDQIEADNLEPFNRILNGRLDRLSVHRMPIDRAALRSGQNLRRGG
jgi:hypothetical protein